MTTRRVAIIGGSVLAGFAIVIITAITVMLILQRGQVMPNTAIAATDVSGMTRAELHATVETMARDRRQDVVDVAFEDDVYTLAASEVDFTLDVPATAQAAFARGREGLFSGFAERIRALRTTATIDPVVSWDDAQLRDWVATLASHVDRGISHGSIDIDPESLTVDVTPPHGSVAVRHDELAAGLADALTVPGDQRIDLPADTEPALVDADELIDVAARAQEAVRAPIELTHGDQTLVLEPADIAQLISVERTARGDRHDVDLVVTPGSVIVVVDADTIASFATEPVDAGYDIGREPPETFDDQSTTAFRPVEVDIGLRPGQAGTRLDPRTTAAQLTELVRAGTRRAQMRLEIVQPDLPTDMLQEQRPTHLLGTFTTYYQAGQARVHNIQRLADTIDGTILLPGQQFSINGISGRRTCEGGYLPAGTIVRGELVDTCGGGTSQFGTTTFNAAFFAGVQLDQWKAHSWYISRYPMGREATLNYPELDVKFTNDTDGAILVKTSHTATSVTVSLYGQPIASEVRAIHGSRSNLRSPSTQVRQTSDLYQDQERVIQSAGSPGFSVRVVREIDRLDGRTVTQNIDTVYLPQHRIVERGTRPRPS